MKVYFRNPTNIIYNLNNVDTFNEYLQVYIKDFKQLTNEHITFFNTHILPANETLITQTNLNTLLFQKLINPDNKISSSTQVQYWLNRGYTIEEATEKISFLQRQKSKWCYEFWLNRGYNKEDAIIQAAAETQISNAKSQLASPVNLTYWLNAGYNQKDAEYNRLKYCKERSVWSKDYYLKNGIDDSLQIKESISKYQTENALKWSKSIKDNPDKYKARTWTNILWWVEKGYTEEEAIKNIAKRCVTNGKDFYIAKYGEELGLEKFNDRMRRWMKSFKHQNFSKVSQRLFWQILEKIDMDDYIDYQFATIKDGNLDNSGRNNEANITTTDGTFRADFLFENKIIEFDGSYWHSGNIPRRISEAMRDVLLTQQGYRIFHVSEQEYTKNPKQVISKCLSFLNS